jgi:hypothetical protein
MQKGDYEGLLKLRMGGQVLNVETSIEGDTVELKIVPELNAPDAGRRLREALDKQVREGTWDGSTFKLSMIHGFHSRLSRLSDLRAAYLAAFAKLGYRYAFSRQLSPVREQLMKPNDEVLPECFCIFLGWEIDEQRDLRIVRDPFHLLFAQIDRYGIILPGLEPPEDPWTPFLERAEKQKLQWLTGSSIGWPVRAEMLLDFSPSAQ